MKNEINFNGKEYQIEIVNDRLEVSVKVDNFVATPWRRILAISVIEKDELTEAIVDELGFRNSEAQAFSEAIINTYKNI